ncbi:hypothetical protein [Halarchaeum sp. P4]|uniref:hypothetical protein n=1 Tax=Halarchaeum sp. P4 TaxID=3421639 RepID=UPI003EBEBF28
MPIDTGAYTSGQHLVEHLEAHNPWWEFDSEFDPAGGVDARRPAYTEAVASLTAGETRRLVVGGTTTTETVGLLEQLIETVLRPEFQEQHIQDAELRDAASDLLVPSENVLRLPLGASPLYQLQPTAGLEAAVDHFQTHIASPEHRQYLFLEGFDTLRRPTRRGDNRGAEWLAALGRITEQGEDLTIVISVPSSTFLADRLASHSMDITDNTEWGLQSLSHLSFESYLRLRHRRLAVTPSAERFEPSSTRETLRHAVRTSEVAPFAEQIRKGDRVLEPATLRRECTMFAVGGGRMATRLARAGVDLDGTQFETILRNRGEQTLQSHQSELVDDLRNEVTAVADRLYGLRDSPGPIRLAALVANERPTGPVEFEAVCDVLDVDRRTLREQYLRVLGELELVGSTPAYANKRPRSLGLTHRDPSVLAAFGGFDLPDALRREPGLTPSLWHAMLYDHTVRLSERVNERRDPKRGVVKHWASDNGVVDFVTKIDGRPIPIVFTPDHTLTDLERGTGSEAYEALRSFLRQTASMADQDSLRTRDYATVPDVVAEQRKAVVEDERYLGTRQEGNVVDSEAPFGIIVTNAREAMEDGIVVDDSGPRPILQLPLWTYLRLG